MGLKIDDDKDLNPTFDRKDLYKGRDTSPTIFDSMKESFDMFLTSVVLFCLVGL